MNPVKFCCAIILLLLCVPKAQTLDSVSGTVLDQTKNPVGGASITFGLLTATTDTNGVYFLNGDVPVRFNPKGLGRASLVLQGNVLKVNLSVPKDIGIDLFSLAGRRIKVMHPGLLQAGAHAISLVDNSSSALSHEAYIVVVHYGAQVYTLRWIRGIGSNGLQLIDTKVAPAGSLHKRTSAIADTLVVSKTGYATRRVFVTDIYSVFPTVVIYKEDSLRKIYVRGPRLPWAQNLVVSSWTQPLQDTLSVAFAPDTSKNFSGYISALKNSSLSLKISFSDSLGTVLGTIASSIDSSRDSAIIDARRVFITGAFAPGSVGTIQVRSWKDSAKDTFLFPLTWDTLNSGSYSGTILVPALASANVVVSIGTLDTGLSKLLGITRTTIASTKDSVRINCKSSLPILTVGADTLLGWGDTMRLHFSATDSIDSIITYGWQFTGKGIVTADTIPNAFTIVPMFCDSIFTCQVSATDANSNTTNATVRAIMTCSVRNFRLADNEVTNWFQTGNFTVYGQGNIAQAIDSTTPFFSKIAEAGVQNMSQIDQRTLSATIIDVGTPAAAYSLFAAKKASIAAGALKTSTLYPDSVVAIDNSPSDGITVYARFKSFFFQGKLGGFVSFDMALLNAEKIIAVYEQRAVKTSICRNE